MTSHAPEKPHIVITQPVHPAVLQRLSGHGTVSMNPGPEPWQTSELHRQLATADAMMAFMPDRVDEITLKHAPRLRTIACALKGHDNFNLAACTRAGVLVSFVPDLLTEPTAELALGLAIAAARHMLAGDRHLRSGQYAGWRPTLYGTGLHGSTAAVLGLGPVGSAIVDRLGGFGCTSILGVDPNRADPRVEMVTVPVALARADYLFLAVPLTPNSHHLLGPAQLARCKRGQIVINVGRGSVVDEAAVAQALEQGLLGAYAADVFEMEDWLLPHRPRQVDPGLLASPHTVLTPHLGSAVALVRRAIEERAADNLLAALTGQPIADALTPGRAAQLA